MIDSNSLLRNSPFKLEDDYNLSNTTPELLKFQLQEEHKIKLKQMSGPSYNDSFIDSDSFNIHLQNKLDEGEISIEEIPSLISSSSSDDENYMDELGKPNYLNLKILIENTAFDHGKLGKNSIISLQSLKRLKSLIRENKELKEYYLSKLTVSQQFIFNLNDNEIEPEILLKIIKSTTSLNQKIMTLNDEIDNLTLQLTNHNLSCLLLGYIEDIKLKGEINAQQDVGTDSQNLRLIFDKFIGHIASIAVQRNISLPAPISQQVDKIDNFDENSLENKFQWVQQCIDSLVRESPINLSTASLDAEELDHSPMTTLPTVDNSSLNDTSMMSLSSIKGDSGDHVRSLNDYKTALNDLRFSHQYLLKEFEYSRESSMKAIQDHRKKNFLLEKELNSLKQEMNVTNPRTHNLTGDDDDAKNREIAKLRKQLNDLKVDKLGELEKGGDNKTSMSNSILRKEFKKIISDMQDQYEIELSHERILRKELQDKLDRKSSD